MRVFLPENIDFSPSTFGSNFPGGINVIPVAVLIECIMILHYPFNLESKSKDLEQQCEHKNPANKERQKCYNCSHHSCYKLWQFTNLIVPFEQIQGFQNTAKEDEASQNG